MSVMEEMRKIIVEAEETCQKPSCIILDIEKLHCLRVESKKIATKFISSTKNQTDFYKMFCPDNHSMIYYGVVFTTNPYVLDLRKKK